MTKEKCKNAKHDLQMANDYPKSKYNDGRVIDNAISIFDKLIEEHFDPQPYKFEEYYDGMWVWDDEWKQLRELMDAQDFEEGRFFPITKANQ